MCSHAPPASLYLSLFSLLRVDIRTKKKKKKEKKQLQNYMTNLKKSTSFSTLQRLTGQKNEGIRFSTG